MKYKIKVVWLCHLSNSRIRNKLSIDNYSLMAILRKILRRGKPCDFAKWNSNAIVEFEKFKDIELHIVSPHSYISQDLHEFDINGVKYHIFKSEIDSLWNILKFRLFKKNSFKKNSEIINRIIKRIDPQIVHIIGAENPEYGESVLYLDDKNVKIVSLQTLLRDPIVLNNYPAFRNSDSYRVDLESKIINKVDYVATKSEHFKSIIREQINSKIKFLSMSLAVGENPNYEECEKVYDFVYFAANISKSVDYAIEAFAIVKKLFPHTSLHVVGGYSRVYMETLKVRMLELGLVSGVDFTGELALHDDVLSEIRKAKFALLPLKSDLISGTIREAMANGLPVISTKTPATPILNSDRESILISEKGDFIAMANNMIKLLSDSLYAQMIKDNAYKTINERYSNSLYMREWKDNYYKIINRTL